MSELNVGIGTTSPTLAPLQTAGFVGNTTAMFGSGTTGVSLTESWPGIDFNAYYNGGSLFMGTGYAAFIDLNPSTGDMYFDLSTASGAAGETPTYITPLYIQHGGNVGVGTTSPSYTLHVDGTVAATSYVTLSDIRLKKDVEPLAYGLDAVMNLRPISFDWKEQDRPWGKAHQIGLAAQEVENVVPEIVSTADDAMHTKSVAYASLVPVLIKAVQEQQGEISELKRQVENLKAGRHNSIAALTPLH